MEESTTARPSSAGYNAFSAKIGVGAVIEKLVFANCAIYLSHSILGIWIIHELGPVHVFLLWIIPVSTAAAFLRRE
jgi:hypothetical protein